MKKFAQSVFSAIFLGAVTLSVSANASDKQEAIDAISNHFKTVPTMTGEFIQFGPNGEQTGGTFYINRPGKMRLDYEKPSPLKLISNGKTLAVSNSKLKTSNYYPLNKTPLSLLLSNQLKLNDKAIRSVDASEDITTIILGDEKIFGDSEITLLFDPENQDLRQWTIKDSQGKETSVMLFNVKKNVKISNTKFAIAKSNIHNRDSRE